VCGQRARSAALPARSPAVTPQRPRVHPHAHAATGRQPEVELPARPGGHAALHDHRHAGHRVPDAVVIAIDGLPAVRWAAVGMQDHGSVGLGLRDQAHRARDAAALERLVRVLGFAGIHPSHDEVAAKPETGGKQRVPGAPMAHDRREVAASEHHAGLAASGQRPLVLERAGPPEVAEAEASRRRRRVRPAPQDALDADGDLPADQAGPAFGARRRGRDRLLNPADDRHRVGEGAEVVERIGRVGRLRVRARVAERSPGRAAALKQREPARKRSRCANSDRYAFSEHRRQYYARGGGPSHGRALASGHVPQHPNSSQLRATRD
jgi:hypothetical protein